MKGHDVNLSKFAMAKYHEMLLNTKFKEIYLILRKINFYFDLHFLPIMTSEVKIKGIERLKITHNSHI